MDVGVVLGGQLTGKAARQAIELHDDADEPHARAPRYQDPDDRRIDMSGRRHGGCQGPAKAAVEAASVTGRRQRAPAA